MLYFRPGSRLVQIVTMLSFVGEFPMRSITMLGKERVLKALIYKLSAPQTICDSVTGKRFQGRVLTISGKGREKSVRLYKGALPLLEWVHPKAYEYYMGSFWGHHFPGDMAHRDRNHRVGEAAVLCMRAGIEARPYLLPTLQNCEILRVVPQTPCFYLAKDLKKIGVVEMNKTMFTRMAGAVFTEGECRAVYNTQDAAMKWNGMGEFKARISLQEAARMNCAIKEVESAFLLGQSGETALRTLEETRKNRRLELRFDAVYHHIYYIQMDEDGIRQLRILSVPDWRENCWICYLSPKPGLTIRAFLSMTLM